MTLTSMREPEVGVRSNPTELLIREARAAARRRRFRVLAVAIVVVAATLMVILTVGNRDPTKNSGAGKDQPKSLTGAKLSPYPATLRMRRGMYEGGIGVDDRLLRWGTILPSAQSRWIDVRSTKSTVEWGVWRRNGDGGLYPVRSMDGGVRWRAAGPLLATDWVGGGIYYVRKVISEGPTSVVMVSNAVIDVTTDGGRQWYQYLNAASDWIVSGVPVSVSIGIRIRPFPDGNLPEGSYGTYVLNSARHEWVRTAVSLGKSS